MCVTFDQAIMSAARGVGGGGAAARTNREQQTVSVDQMPAEL